MFGYGLFSRLVRWPSVDSVPADTPTCAIQFFVTASDPRMPVFVKLSNEYDIEWLYM